MVLAVIAGDGVRLDLVASVSALGEVVDAPEATFALGVWRIVLSEQQEGLLPLTEWRAILAHELTLKGEW